VGDESPPQQAPAESLSSQQQERQEQEQQEQEESSKEQSILSPKTSSWAGLLKAPSQSDIRGKRRRPKVFDAPIRCFDFLVVLDFEWTCDKVKNPPPAEIIEFPSVLVDTGVPPPTHLCTTVARGRWPTPCRNA